MNFLLEPLQYAFIQRAMLAGALVGILCATIGVYVVLRRMSFIGHALTHAAFPGVVGAYLLKWDLAVGSAAATFLTAAGIGWFSSKDESVYEDTAIGIMASSMFALGILMISLVRSYRDLSGILFGNILGVTDGRLIVMGLVAACVVVIILLFHKELDLFCYDPVYAKAIGIRLGVLRHTLLWMLAATVVVGIQIVGAILTSALLVTPAATARLLTDRHRTIMIWSCVVAVSSAFAGIYASYYWNWSSGASIVIVSTIWFGAALAWSSFRKKYLVASGSRS